ncbi:888_t:CDS:2, partial [Funneliformis geosporum]
AELFTSSLGSTTDVIHKEMYTFTDRKGRQLALRPEGTATNMFRYERPQAGRYREFWQLGVELINAPGVIADYQILKLISDILESLGITDFTFNLNYLGGNETKENYKKELVKFIKQNNPDLCTDCQRRYQTNPLRILDCSTCQTITFPTYET